MRLFIQRVLKSDVTVDGKVIGKIGKGLMILIGIENEDTEEDIEWLCKKTSQLRIFDDENGVMNKSIMDIDGEVLIISQFTLMAQTAKGNRPSYIKAAKPDISRGLYEEFCANMSQKLGKNVETGQFQADMKVSLINDGPVSIWMDSKNKNY